MNGKIPSVAPGASEKIEVTFQVNENNSKSAVAANLSLKHLSNRFPQTVKATTKKDAQKQPGKLEYVSHILKNTEDQISRGKPTEVILNIKNTGGDNLNSSNLTITASEGIRLLSAKSAAVKALEPGEEQKITVQFEAPEDFESTSFEIAVSGSTGFKKSFDFNLGELPKIAQPVADLIAFEESEIFKNETANLSIKIKNEGNGISQNLKIELEFPEEPAKASSKSGEISAIEPNGVSDKKFSIEPGEGFQGEELEVLVKISGKDLPVPITKTITLKLKAKPAGIAFLEHAFESSVNPGKIANKNNPAERNEILTLSIQIKNTGGRLISTRGINISTPKGIHQIVRKNVKSEDINPNDVYTHSLIFRVEESFIGKSADFEVAIQSDDISETKIFTLPIKAIPPIVEVEKVSNLLAFNRDKLIDFVVKVKNTGGTDLQNAVVDWSGTKSIVWKEGKTLSVGTLKANESREVPITLVVPEAFLGAGVELKMKVTGNHPDFTTGKEEVFVFPVNQKAKEVELTHNTTWDYPRPSDYRNLQKTTNVRLNVTTNKKLNEKKFILFHNGKPVISSPGQRAGEEPLVKTAKRYGSGNLYPYEFEQKITLKEDKSNKLVLMYKLANNKLIELSEEIEFLFTEKQINIHLLAIGVNEYDDSGLKDLKFAGKDAEALSGAYEELKTTWETTGGKIIPYLQISKSATTKTRIKGAVSQLKEFVDKNEIQENDIIIFYFAGHGKNENGTFYLVPSDYQRKPTEESEDRRVSSLYDYKSSLIDFEKEIMKEYFNKIANRNIFIFLDACHSGAADEGYDDQFFGARSDEETPVSQILTEIWNRKDRDIVMVNSCQPDESSFESPEEKHGFFTLALLEAFDNKTVPVLGGKKMKASSDNNALNFGELFDFLEQRVPYLAKKIGKEQTPYLPLKEKLKRARNPKEKQILSQKLQDLRELDFFLTN